MVLDMYWISHILFLLQMLHKMAKHLNVKFCEKDALISSTTHTDKEEYKWREKHAA